MEEGWIKLHRELLDSRMFKDPDPWIWKIWCWCLLSASSTGGRGLDPGQFVMELPAAARRLDCEPGRLYRGLCQLAEWGEICLDVGSRFTVVTVCDWALYRMEEAGHGSQRKFRRGLFLYFIQSDGDKGPIKIGVS